MRIPEFDVVVLVLEAEYLMIQRLLSKLVGLGMRM